MNGGRDWLGTIAVNGCSAIQIGIPQRGAKICGRDWPGTVAANSHSMIKVASIGRMQWQQMAAAQ
jgi:hypothetical protein